MITADQHKLARCAWLLSRQLIELHAILRQIFDEEFTDLDQRELQQRVVEENDLPF